VGLVEEPLLGLHGAGEGALDVAEELAFEERFREGGTVHGEKAPVDPGTGIMDEAGDEFLAGAALAEDQHIRIAVGDLPRQLDDFAEAGAAKDRLRRRLAIAQLFFQRLVFLDQPFPFQAVLDEGEEFFLGKGLAQIIIGAELHRLHRRLDGAMPGHHHHRQFGPGLTHPAQGLDTVHLRHLHVEQKQVAAPVRLFETADQEGRTGEGLDLIAPGFDHLPQVAQHPLFVVTDQNPIFHVILPCLGLPMIHAKSATIQGNPQR